MMTRTRSEPRPWATLVARSRETFCFCGTPDVPSALVLLSETKNGEIRTARTPIHSIGKRKRFIPANSGKTVLRFHFKGNGFHFKGNVGTVKEKSRCCASSGRLLVGG